MTVAVSAAIAKIVTPSMRMRTIVAPSLQRVFTRAFYPKGTKELMRYRRRPQTLKPTLMLRCERGTPEPQGIRGRAARSQRGSGATISDMKTSKYTRLSLAAPFAPTNLPPILRASLRKASQDEAVMTPSPPSPASGDFSRRMPCAVGHLDHCVGACPEDAGKPDGCHRQG